MELLCQRNLFLLIRDEVCIPCSLQNIEAFLSLLDNVLYAGFSLLLRKDAWRCGSEADAVSYLMSAGTQNEIDGFLRKALKNSLDAERKHHQDRGPDNAKARSLATASRTQLLDHYALHREAHVTQNIALAKQVKAYARSSPTSVA